MITTPRPTVSIVIKALNEERHIATAIESALAALDGVHGEVILADSASTDRTVKIAERYPIKIVSMSRIEDRSCGAGGQLGYQYSFGDYICLIDGDMRLYRGFVAAAIRYLEFNPEVAGVGGMIIELEKDNFEYVKRATRDDPDRRPGKVAHLDCGGVYRRAAIELVGYFTDRNLHGTEELELGARLRAKGWTIARIDRPAIDHYGHAGNAFRLLRQRWKSQMAFSMGEVLRSSSGRPYFPSYSDKSKVNFCCWPPSTLGGYVCWQRLSSSADRLLAAGPNRDPRRGSIRRDVGAMPVHQRRHLFGHRLECVRSRHLARPFAAAFGPRRMDHKHDHSQACIRA